MANTGKDHPNKADHVILFWNGGGMSHIDTWDPKPGRPVQGEFSPIKTSAPGVEISAGGWAEEEYDNTFIFGTYTTWHRGHSAARRSDGSVVVWGDGSHGPLRGRRPCVRFGY